MKLVIGLFIMITLLNPLLELVHIDFQPRGEQILDFDRNADDSAAGREIHSRGEAVRGKGQSAAEDEMLRGWEDQIRAVVAMNGDYDVQEVEVVTTPQGELERLELWVTSPGVKPEDYRPANSVPEAESKVEIAAVEPITLDSKSEKKKLKEEQEPKTVTKTEAERLAENLARFYSLPQDRVEVRMDGG